MSGWMYTEDNVSASDGADAHVIQVGSVYTWLFSVYGWGMDYGISDGWGSFPPFDNPMEGVDRTRLSRVLALISADDELTELVFDNAVDEFMAAVEALYSVYSTQDEIDACIEALLAALDGVPARRRRYGRRDHKRRRAYHNALRHGRCGAFGSAGRACRL